MPLNQSSPLTKHKAKNSEFNIGRLNRPSCTYQTDSDILKNDQYRPIPILMPIYWASQFQQYIFFQIDAIDLSTTGKRQIVDILITEPQYKRSELPL